MTRIVSLFLAILLFILASGKIQAYSVLTHQAMIDAVWDNSIVPVLLAKYPDKNNPEDLRKAKAYAYGGAIIPDIGYFPKGNRLFTNLLHYVRTGDFVVSLFNDAKNINELSFASGVLAHYLSDVYGHSIGINRIIPLLYLRLKKKYGDTITYEESPSNHLRAEFSFDVMAVAKGNYSSEDYHEYIGFEVAQEQLERAFNKTYGFELSILFPHFKETVNFFRWTIVRFIPRITRIGWRVKRKEIERSIWKIERRSIVYKFHQKNYQKQFGKGYKAPGLLTKLGAALAKVIPKEGILKVFTFKAPSPIAYSRFTSSFEAAFQNYSLRLSCMATEKDCLKNLNWDTGLLTTHHEYCLADKSYYKLLQLNKKKKLVYLNTELRENIYSFYNATKGSNSKRVNLLMEELKNAEIK
jgi:hypothetical protein